MLLQWQRLHTKSVACMSKDVHLLWHTREDTICTCSSYLQFVYVYMINGWYVSCWYSS